MNGGESDQPEPASVCRFDLFEAVSASSLTFFRVVFGTVLAAWGWDYITSGRLRSLYVEAPFHFTYQTLPFVSPPAGDGLYVLVLAMTVLALMVATGLFYRLAATSLAIAWIYFFLLEKTNYQNHYYLTILICGSLAVMPMHRQLSLDVWLGRVAPSGSIPRWCVWLTRFHIGLPYVFGGIAKLNPDWMLGEPMRTHLSTKADVPLVGDILSHESAGLLFSYGGLSFDLAVVPALLWPRTRRFAYVGCVIFHVVNSALFDIHIFPWLMILATTVFFKPDWPERLLSVASGAGSRVLEGTISGANSPAPKTADARSVRLRKLGLLCLSGYMIFHVTWPFRHRLYGGDASWTEQGHLFAWRMMLRIKHGGVRYYVTDPRKRETTIPDLRAYLTPEQLGKFPRDPAMVLQLAHELARRREQELGYSVEVRALVLLSLNGRAPQPLIDSNVDLTRIPAGSKDRWWVLPQRESLRAEPWDYPLLQWEQLVELPPLEFLDRAPLVRDERRPG